MTLSEDEGGPIHFDGDTSAPNVTKYPLDFDALVKGTWIETDELEKAVGMRSGTETFSLRVVRLAASIRERCGIVCRQEGHRLRLMSDEEVAPYAMKRATEGVRTIRRAAGYVQDIDMSRLSDSQRRHAEAVSMATAAIATASHRELRAQTRRVLAPARKALKG